MVSRRDELVQGFDSVMRAVKQEFSSLSNANPNQNQYPNGSPSLSGPGPGPGYGQGPGPNYGQGPGYGSPPAPPAPPRPPGSSPGLGYPGYGSPSPAGYGRGGGTGYGPPPSHPGRVGSYSGGPSRAPSSASNFAGRLKTAAVNIQEAAMRPNSERVQGGRVEVASGAGRGSVPPPLPSTSRPPMEQRRVEDEARERQMLEMNLPTYSKEAPEEPVQDPLPEQRPQTREQSQQQARSSSSQPGAVAGAGPPMITHSVTSRSSRLILSVNSPPPSDASNPNRTFPYPIFVIPPTGPGGSGETMITGILRLELPEPEGIDGLKVRVKGITRSSVTTMVQGKNKNRVEKHTDEAIFYEHGSTPIPPNTSHHQYSSHLQQTNQSATPGHLQGSFAFNYTLRLPSRVPTIGGGYYGEGIGGGFGARGKVLMDLPPSFVGGGGEGAKGEMASVRYYLKVTLMRHGKLKPNDRLFLPIVVLPLSPPLSPPLPTSVSSVTGGGLPKDLGVLFADPKMEGWTCAVVKGDLGGAPGTPGTSTSPGAPGGSGGGGKFGSMFKKKGGEGFGPGGGDSRVEMRMWVREGGRFAKDSSIPFLISVLSFSPSFLPPPQSISHEIRITLIRRLEIQAKGFTDAFEEPIANGHLISVQDARGGTERIMAGECVLRKGLGSSFRAPNVASQYYFHIAFRNFLFLRLPIELLTPISIATHTPHHPHHPHHSNVDGDVDPKNPNLPPHQGQQQQGFASTSTPADGGGTEAGNATSLAPPPAPAGGGTGSQIPDLPPSYFDVVNDNDGGGGGGGFGSLMRKN